MIWYGGVVEIGKNDSCYRVDSIMGEKLWWGIVEVVIVDCRKKGWKVLLFFVEIRCRGILILLVGKLF